MTPEEIEEMKGKIKEAHQMGKDRGFILAVKNIIGYFEQGWHIEDLPQLHNAALKNFQEKYGLDRTMKDIEKPLGKDTKP